MDIVEFAEKFMHVELLEYQKTFLREFDRIRTDGKVRIVTGRNGQIYIYLDPKTRKELIQNG